MCYFFFYLFSLSSLLLDRSLVRSFRDRSLSRLSRLRRSLSDDTSEVASFSDGDVTLQVYQSIEGIGRELWNSLLSSDASPFLHYDWIHTLERSGCASAREGWDAVHLVFYHSKDKHKPIMALPLYLKYHSYGEFIFDQSWADYAQRVLGIQYYPKMLCAIPFTPAAGKRIAIPSKATLIDGASSSNTSDSSNAASTFSDYSLRLHVAMQLKAVACANKLSSANVNFMHRDEAQAFVDAGYRLRETIQYRWTNKNPSSGLKYANFDEYLAHFKSKRRVQIKRERSSVYADQGMRIEVLRGDDIRVDEELMGAVHDIYATTVDKMWGQRYLKPAFFTMLAQTPIDFRKHIVLVLAYDPQDKLVAGTFNLASTTHFYGRYWGCFRDVKNLHFETCYYKAIEYCIQHGLDYMEPGAGGGEFKYLRGFDPYIVNSVHFFTSPTLQGAVSDFLDMERTNNNALSDYLLANSKVAAGKQQQQQQM